MPKLPLRKVRQKAKPLTATTSSKASKQASAAPPSVLLRKRAKAASAVSAPLPQRLLPMLRHLLWPARPKTSTLHGAHWSLCMVS